MKMLPVIAMLLIIFNYDLSSKPCGYMSSTTVTLLINGCEYEVKICFDCAFTDPNENAIFISEWNKKPWWCNQTWNHEDVYAEIQNIVFSWNFIKQYICLDATIEPCDQPKGVIEFTLIKTLCWQMQKRDGLIYFQPCSENGNTCEEVWRYCYNTVPPDIGPVRIFVSSSGSVGECPEEIPDEPKNELEISNCFKLGKTACD